MKKLILSATMVLAFNISTAQTYVEKYNSLNGRYEYFDKENGKMVAYSSYNSINGTWETTYVNNSNQNSGGKYVPQKQRIDDNFALLYKVMENRQSRFDSNYKKVQDHINSFSQRTRNTFGKDPRLVDLIIYEFNNGCVKKLNAMNYDLSDDAVTNNIINYLTDCYNSLLNK
ncbi:MAG: hypothetical protein KDC69_09210 [Flavobacteriaceae bacterium]|nr:hypothetical protein [Flavobacteriaceae bacterium]MCB0747471.1 hypothetical protein [Ignavibacteriota bacterium]